MFIQPTARTYQSCSILCSIQYNSSFIRVWILVDSIDVASISKCENRAFDVLLPCCSSTPSFPSVEYSAQTCAYQAQNVVIWQDQKFIQIAKHILSFWGLISVSCVGGKCLRWMSELKSVLSSYGQRYKSFFTRLCFLSSSMFCSSITWNRFLIKDRSEEDWLCGIQIVAVVLHHDALVARWSGDASLILGKTCQFIPARYDERHVCWRHW